MNAPADDPFVIDQNHLHTEWLAQPGLARAAGQREADARHALAQAKASLDVAVADARYLQEKAKADLQTAEAQAELDVRKNPEKFGLGAKPTIPEVSAAVAVQPGVRAARDALVGRGRVSPEVISATAAVNDHRKLLDYAEAETRAYVDRRKALENLVELLGLRYFDEMEPKALDPATRERIADRGRRRVREGIDPDET